MPIVTLHFGVSILKKIYRRDFKKVIGGTFKEASDKWYASLVFVHLFFYIQNKHVKTSLKSSVDSIPSYARRCRWGIHYSFLTRILQQGYPDLDIWTHDRFPRASINVVSDKEKKLLLA